MKPRLESAPLTDEDSRMWVNLMNRWWQPSVTLYRYELADRRDADLMSDLCEYRAIGAYANVRRLQTMAGQDGCAVGGWRYRWESDRWSDGRKIT